MSEAALPTRVVGIETEYGISVVSSGGVPRMVSWAGPSSRLQHDEPGLHPMQLSNHVVKGYAATYGYPDSAHWDYHNESPLRDLRGFQLSRQLATPDQLTDADPGMANVILTNGARLYVDHAHPEYSGPEVTSARAAALYDKAGDAVMALAARAASRSLGTQLRLYKNNTDGKGASYGTHENFLLRRETPFDRIVTQFTGFLVSRVPVVGAGRVGLGQHSDRPGFQISQRADFFEAEVGLETTLNRPIINTRDEPHADPRTYRRLHVITGDATQSEISTWLKVGTAGLVLRLIEAGALPEPEGVRLAHPVAAMRAISHDPSCRVTVSLADGRKVRAVDLQQTYLDACREHLRRDDGWTEGERTEAGALLEAWQTVLDDLRTEPMRLADRLDWVAKLRLMRSYVERDGLEWDAPKLALIDLQWADVDPSRSLYHAMIAKGRMRRLFTDEQIEAARLEPPEDTRAWFRGKVMERFGSKVAAASWDSIIFDLASRPALQRVPLTDPLRGTRAQMEDVLARAESAEQLFALLHEE